MKHSNYSLLRSSRPILSAGVVLYFCFVAALSARNESPRAYSAIPSIAGIQQSQSTAKPNFAGQWTLNKDQSDDPREKMQQAMANSGEGGGGGRGFGAGGGSGRRGGGGGGRGPGMFNDLSQLTIEQSENSVKVTGASGRILAAYPAAQETSKPSSNSNTEGEAREYTPPVAKWQGSQLVTSTERPRGGSTTRTYELSSDGKQLIVTTKMQNPRFSQPVTIRFVYDPAKANTGSNN